MKCTKGLFLLAGISFFISSCSFFGNKGGKPTAQNPGQVSTATGIRFNDADGGGFAVTPYDRQPDAPNTVFIEGGRAVLGSFEEDIMAYGDNVERTVSVASFFMDETEIANIHWLEFLKYLSIDSPRSSDPNIKDAYSRNLPDTNVWRGKMAFNDPYVEHYLRYPGFRYFPVVGVSWKQANEFSKWRTSKVNDELARQSGRDDLKPTTPGGRIPIESGVVVPDYRLPTEAEWEYAAYGLLDQNPSPRKKESGSGEELISNQQIYSWSNNPNGLRDNRRGSWQGKFLANFKRGSGDNMGVAGGLNDRSAIPGNVKAFYPNAFGLYNMSGNVSEWVQDTYRALTPADGEDFNYFRGNKFQKYYKNSAGEFERDSLGRLKKSDISDEEVKNRRNYQHNYAMDHLDGDSSSGASYEYGVTTLISDRSKVFKGGSWNDRAYWLSPGARRFLEEEQSSSTIGFRCAQTYMGSPEGPGFREGNIFGKRKQNGRKKS